MSTSRRPASDVRAPRTRVAPLARGPGRYDRSQSATQRRAAQRDALLAAAGEVFAAKGYAGATVAAVIARAGMSRRTFYEHFDDLRDALLQVHDAAVEMAFGLVEAGVRGARDPEAKLRAGIEAFLAAIAAHGGLARVIFREVRAAGPRYEVRHQRVLARFGGLLFEGIAEAYAAGAAKRPPDELTVFALVAAVEAVGMRYVERREEARAMEAAPALTELVLRAFR